MTLRKLTSHEERFLEFMIRLAALKLPPDWKEKIRVSPMDDGNMGSLQLYPSGDITPKRVLGKVAAEYQFKDVDRADVLAALNLDQHGELFELDIWKTNFDPLIAFPEASSLS